MNTPHLDITPYLPEMSDDFRAHMTLCALMARITGKAGGLGFGEHGTGCECNVDRTIMVFVGGEGEVAIAAHKQADLKQYWEFLRTHAGHRLAEAILEDPECPYGYYSDAAREQGYSKITEAPSWLNSLNLGLISEEV